MLEGLSQPLLEKLTRGETTHYTTKEQDELIGRLQYKRLELIEEFIDAAKGFRMVVMPPALLETLPILYTMAWRDLPVTLGEYADIKHDPSIARDPRVAATHYVATPPYGLYPGFPILGHCKKRNCTVLVEGYSRCIGTLRKVRAGESVKPIPMIYCEPAATPTG